MTDPKIETVQTIYEAFGRGDVPTILDHLTDDVDWAAESFSASAAPWAGVCHGKDEVAGGEGVGLAQAERQVLGRPVAQPRQLDHRRDEVLEGHAAVQPDVAVPDRGGKGPQCPDPGPGQAHTGE